MGIGIGMLQNLEFRYLIYDDSHKNVILIYNIRMIKISGNIRDHNIKYYRYFVIYHILLQFI